MDYVFQYQRAAEPLQDLAAPPAFDTFAPVILFVSPSHTKPRLRTDSNTAAPFVQYDPQPLAWNQQPANQPLKRRPRTESSFANFIDTFTLGNVFWNYDQPTTLLRPRKAALYSQLSFDNQPRYVNLDWVVPPDFIPKKKRPPQSSLDATTFYVATQPVVVPVLSTWYVQEPEPLPSPWLRSPAVSGYFTTWMQPTGEDPPVILVENDAICGEVVLTPTIKGTLYMDEEVILPIGCDCDIEWRDAEFQSSGNDITDANGVTATAVIKNAAGDTLAGSSVTATYDSSQGCWRATFPYTLVLVEGALYYPEMTLITTIGAIARGKRRLERRAGYLK